MTDLCTEFQMSIFVQGEESYDCQRVMNNILIQSDQSPLSDLYSSKYIQRDVIQRQSFEKKDQLRHQRSTYEQNQFLHSDRNLDEEKDERSNQAQNSSTKLNEQKQDSIQKIPKYTKKIGKQLKGKPNNCDSKNFFLFLWKKILKRLNESSRTDYETKMIHDLTHYNGSMQSLNYLFSLELLKDMTEKMFNQKYFNRCIMTSSISGEYKKKYLGFVKRVETCYYKDKRIDNLR